MNRLTKQWGNNPAVPCNFDLDFLLSLDKDTADGLQEFFDRLAAYEDAGLEPRDIISAVDMAKIACALHELNAYKDLGSIEHLRELIQAEQDGRLVVLPCKVGDSVYIPDLEKKIPIKVRVQGISISVSGRTILHFGGYPVECAWGDGCGKDWFLSCGEAEAALAQEGGTHEADSV